MIEPAVELRPVEVVKPDVIDIQEVYYETPVIVNQPHIVKPIIEHDVVDRLHVIPKPMDDSAPVEIKEVHMTKSETIDHPI